MALLVLFVLAEVVAEIMKWYQAKQQADEYAQLYSRLLDEGYGDWPYYTTGYSNYESPGIRLRYRAELDERGPQLFYRDANETTDLLPGWRLYKFNGVPATENSGESIQILILDHKGVTKAVLRPAEVRK